MSCLVGFVRKTGGIGVLKFLRVCCSEVIMVENAEWSSRLSEAQMTPDGPWQSLQGRSLRLRRGRRHVDFPL